MRRTIRRLALGAGVALTTIEAGVCLGQMLLGSAASAQGDPDGAAPRDRPRYVLPPELTALFAKLIADSDVPCQSDPPATFADHQRHGTMLCLYDPVDAPAGPDGGDDGSGTAPGAPPEPPPKPAHPRSLPAPPADDAPPESSRT